LRLSEYAHLPFDKPFDRLTVLSKVEGLMVLSKVEGLRYPHPSSLRGVGPPGRRLCGVLLCTPHSSGFVRASLGLPTLRAGPQFRPAAKLAGWTFSISLSEVGFATVSLGTSHHLDTTEIYDTGYKCRVPKINLRI
jgi:hypothetical protein